MKKVHYFPAVCGPHLLTVTNQTKTLTSPNYPNSYPSNLKCSWILSGEGMYESKIYIRFPEFDLIENNNSLPTCNEDRIEITGRNVSFTISNCSFLIFSNF